MTRWLHTPQPSQKSANRAWASALLDAEMKLGELFKGLEKHERLRTDLGSTDGTQTKYEVIESLGFTDPKKTAHRFEMLAEYPEEVRILAGGKRCADAGENIDYHPRKISPGENLPAKKTLQERSTVRFAAPVPVFRVNPGGSCDI